MKNHIQGPWRKGAGISDVIVNDAGEYVASVWGRTADESKARTSVVAAAPELLETVKTLHGMLTWHLNNGAQSVGMDMHFMKVAAQVIEKAEGGAA